LTYRADIDGLRAIAVLSVVLFHLDVPGFAGGYVGVDIFFVISGYLITSIIKRGYENHTFTLREFYSRRIRRLLPALIATVVATFIAATFALTPYDMQGFARSVVAALFSLSNIVFFMESGYWDTASELKPLLHTWSLGVEEQFYILWPALILGLLSIRHVLPFNISLVLITLAGAALCIWYTSINQSAAFFLLPFRVFQFTLGALLISVIAALRARAEPINRSLYGVAFWAGMLCIFGSVYCLGDSTIFPGWVVLLPTIGAFLLLLAGASPAQSAPVARWIMQNPLSVQVGRMSYSLYLVHWPLVSLYRYQWGVELTIGSRLGLALAMLIATLFLHHGVERRFYHPGRMEPGLVPKLPNPVFAFRTLAISVLLSVPAVNAWLGEGWAWRFPSISLGAEEVTAGRLKRFEKYQNACDIADPDQQQNCNFDADLQVLVLGNSFEPDGYNFMHGMLQDDPRVNLIKFGTIFFCANMRLEADRVVNDIDHCQVRFDTLLDPAVVSNLDILVYSFSRPYSAKRRLMLRVLRNIKKLNPEIKIVTFGGYIFTNRDCAYLFNKSGTTDSCAEPENVAIFSDEPELSPLFTEFRAIESHYIDRVALLCRNRILQNCLTRTATGVPAFYDRLHNSIEFAEMSGKLYAEKYPGLLDKLTAGEPLRGVLAN